MKPLRVFCIGVIVSISVPAIAEAENAEHLRQLLETGECIGCDLVGADLSGRDLRGVDLADADLAGADLTGADLTGAKLIDANLLGANLTDAILIDTDLSGAILDDITVSLRALWQAIICYTWLPNGQLYLLQQNCP